MNLDGSRLLAPGSAVPGGEGSQMLEASFHQRATLPRIDVLSGRHVGFTRHLWHIHHFKLVITICILITSISIIISTISTTVIGFNDYYYDYFMILAWSLSERHQDWSGSAGGQSRGVRAVHAGRRHCAGIEEVPPKESRGPSSHMPLATLILYRLDFDPKSRNCH